MKTNKFGEIILDQDDLCDEIMKGREIWNLKDCVVDSSIDIQTLAKQIENPESILTWTFTADETQTIAEFDQQRQEYWFMPDEYRRMDIAEHLLNLCDTQEKLQRVGEELILYQERGLFDLLRYLKYLADVMEQNHIIWGVGRGSSVASYVLYLLGIHRIDSMFYDLDPREFLR
jgi:DNA polymerase III alpha subunit